MLKKYICKNYYEYWYKCRPEEEDLKQNDVIKIRTYFPKKIKTLMVCATTGRWEGTPFPLITVDDFTITHLKMKKIIQQYKNKIGFKTKNNIRVQNNKEKIIQILTNDLKYCDCDNCKYGDYETYKDEFCDGCYRKYSNWALSSATAEEIVDKLSQLGEIYPASKEELKEAINNAE